VNDEELKGMEEQEEGEVRVLIETCNHLQTARYVITDMTTSSPSSSPSSSPIPTTTTTTTTTTTQAAERIIADIASRHPDWKGLFMVGGIWGGPMHW